MPVGKKPVSLSSPPMMGGVRRSFSGDEELTPPPFRTLPAQTALEAFPPPSTSREFSPSLKTGNSDISTSGTAGGKSLGRVVGDKAWSGMTDADSLNLSFSFNFKNSFSLVFGNYFTEVSSGRDFYFVINHF